MPAFAQDWVTRDVCTVTAAQMDAPVMPPETLARLEQEAANFPNGTGRYWRIESAEGAVSYLWGTYHSTDPLILNLPDIVEQEIKASRVIAPEIDFIFADRAAIVKSREYIGWIREEDALVRQFETSNTGIPANIIARIRKRTEGLGWNAGAPDYLTLAGLASLLLDDPCNDFASGVLPIQDERIQMMGMIAGAKVIGLEPANAFMEYLNDPKNRATALSILNVYGAYLFTDADARVTSFALYNQGRVGVMLAWDSMFLRGQLGTQSDKHLRRTDDYLLDQRNRDFLTRALPELTQGGVFMAIGAFHLPGENGMVELLRDAGFSVTRIPTPTEVPTQ